MSLGKSIGFIGAGQMAEALIRGFISGGVADVGSIATTDINSERLELMKTIGVSVHATSEEVAQRSQIIFMCTKPNHIQDALRNMSGKLSKDQLVVSIAAGTTLASLEACAPGIPVVRVMPNTPCFVNETAAAMCLGSHATAEHEADVQALFGAVGKIHTVPEKLMDAVTGLSGSGPAYVYLMVEALADGGVAAGLPRNVAQELAAQTVLGGAKMVLESGRHPGALKDAVCSPGGTTIAGVHELEKAGVRAALMNAVVAATNRAHELGKM